MTAYREEAANAGRSSHVVLMRDAFIAESYREAAAHVGEAIVAEQLFYYQGRGLKAMHPSFTSPIDFSIDNLRPHLVLGTAEDCISQLERFPEEFDVDSLILRLRFPLASDSKRAQQAIDEFGASVLPHFADRSLADPA